MTGLQDDPGRLEKTSIRAFTRSDRADLLALFDRAGAGAPSASLWGHSESEAAVYLTTYMDLEPGSLFVAVIDGALVGYLTGCLDSRRFPTESDRLDQAITQYRLLRRPRALGFFARAALDTALARARRRPTACDFDDPRWPAHLHMNVLPEARGRGVGTALMQRWFDVLASVASPGCHLQTLAQNARAVRFFGRMGFVRRGPTPEVPGVRHRNRRVHQQTMVRPAELVRAAQDDSSPQSRNYRSGPRPSSVDEKDTGMSIPPGPVRRRFRSLAHAKLLTAIYPYHKEKFQCAL